LADRDIHVVQLRTLSQIGPVRRHADDGETLRIQGEALAQHLRARCELTLPQAGTNQHNRSRADFIFSGGKPASQKWLDTKKREQVGADKYAVQLLRISHARKAESCI